MKRSYLVIVGARPNFIKAAPLLHRMREFKDISFTLVHTGQHFDDNMSEIFFNQMGIPKPDIQFVVDEKFFSERMGKLTSKLEDVISKGEYDGVIVFGDIDSTLAGALAATKSGKKLIHIEAGLRSYDRRMPEETNRVIVDHLSSLLLVSEQSGLDNLISEGISEERMVMVGNIMVESIELFKENFDKSDVLNDLSLKSGEFIVSTIHRAENITNKTNLTNILTMLDELSTKYKVIFPLHPATKKSVIKFGLESKLRLLDVIEPVGYIDFMKLVKEAKGVVTDSGGIQEETSHIGVPCCTLRDNTERPVTISLGTNKLFDVKNLDVNSIILHTEKTDFVPAQIPLWDGEVSKRILNLL